MLSEYGAWMVLVGMTGMILMMRDSRWSFFAQMILNFITFIANIGFIFILVILPEMLKEISFLRIHLKAMRVFVLGLLTLEFFASTACRFLQKELLHYNQAQQFFIRGISDGWVDYNA